MKIDNKKKKIIIIAAVIILIAAIATTVGVLCSKKAKQSENTESQTVTVDVTDENGEIVTDENGKIVTKAEEVKDKTSGDKKTSADGKDDNGKKNNNNSGNKNNDNNSVDQEQPDNSVLKPSSNGVDDSAGIEIPAYDDGTITVDSALQDLTYYYGDSYTVTLDKSNTNYKNGVFVYNVVKKDNNYKIVYRVTVQESNGNTLQIDENGNSTNITDKVFG